MGTIIQGPVTVKRISEHQQKTVDFAGYGFLADKSGDPNSFFVLISDILGTAAHNDLIGLQGGQVDEFYHLTEAQHTAIGTGIPSRIQDADNDTFVDAAAGNIIKLGIPTFATEQGYVLTNGATKDIFEIQADGLITVRKQTSDGSDVLIFEDGNGFVFARMEDNGHLFLLDDNANPNIVINGGGAFTTAANNVILGGGQAITTAIENVVIGRSCATKVTTGGQNVLLGVDIGRDAAAGIDPDSNVVLGYRAAFKLTGDFNVFIGSSSGFNNTNSNNVIIGTGAGVENNGSGNVFLGRNAGREETGSNTFMLHNQQPSDEADGRAKSLFYGIMSATPANQDLTINANIYNSEIKSGATQGGAGADADEIWKTAGHATLPDNVLLIGV